MKTIRTLFSIVFFLVCLDVIVMVWTSEWRFLEKAAVIGLILIFYIGVHLEAQNRRDEKDRQELNRRTFKERIDQLKDKP